MKRIFDLLIVIGMAPFFVPVLLLVMLAVRIRLGAPMFFRQERAGFNGRTFRVLKFRTMTNARDAHGNLLPDADRLPPFGRFLRSTSLDELPGLFNVVMNDMSLVGPRPFMAQYLPLYSAEQMRRHDVIPGITGWAQVMGRNSLSWEEKFALDLWYVDNRSFFLDLKILWMTAIKVIARHGVAQDGEATMPLFTGTPGA